MDMTLLVGLLSREFGLARSDGRKNKPVAFVPQ
jgi:hypothetical protein